MKDLTDGSIAGHLLALAWPTMVGMLCHTLYYFVDLYFVAEAGEAAVAGVSAAANFMFVVLALTQVLGVGTATLVSHAVGRQDSQDVNLIFNQSLLFGGLSSLFSLILGYAVADPYLRFVGADEAMAEQGRIYLHWFMPGMALQFYLVVLTSALRGTGVIKPVMIVQASTVLLNTALAPVLISGWGTGHAMGVAGAGLASTISIAFGAAAMGVYFWSKESYVQFNPALWRPNLLVWKRIVSIGLPAGGELPIIFLYTAITYWAIRDFGAAAQAGFGIGVRIMQAVLLPAMAIGFVVPAIAGQNYGARRMARVRETFRIASVQCAATMLVVMVLCQCFGESMVSIFSADPEVIQVASVFLQLTSWSFVVTGITFTCSGLFQALGNTVPALVSSALRLAFFALPLTWLKVMPGYELEHVWYLSLAAGLAQGLISIWLLQKQMRLRLQCA